MGDKVNDSQSFQQEDSFKDNYMQSGNTSALSSNTSKIKPIIPTVTIPYGEEEGGLRDKFKQFKENRKADFDRYKGVFTGHSDFQGHAKSGEGFDPETEEKEAGPVKGRAMNEDDLSKFDDEPAEASIFAMVASGNSVGLSHQAFLNMTDEMIDNKRKALIGHHKNDEHYEKIITSLKEIKSILSSKVNAETQSGFNARIDYILEEYGRVDAALEEYLISRKDAKTPSGMKRLAQIEVYRSLLNRDKETIPIMAKNISIEEAHGKSSYNELIFEWGRKTTYTDEKATTHAHDLYDSFSAEKQHSEMLRKSILFIYAKTPMVNKKGEKIEPETVADMFLAAYLENNPYKSDIVGGVQPDDGKYSAELLEKIREAILKSPVNDKYPFCRIGSEALANSPKLLPYFIDFLKFAEKPPVKAIDIDGPPEDDK